VTGCTAGSQAFTIVNGDVRVDYDLTAGTATFSYAGAKKITGFYAGVRLATYVTSKMYASRTCSASGAQVVVTETGPGLPTMQQVFVADGGRHFLTQLVVQGKALASNWMGPVVEDTPGGVDVGTYGDPRLLWVPFDNDMFVTYNAAPMTTTGTSFEVAAFYDDVSRHAIVVGSVTHDTWKTGIYYKGNAGKLDALNVFGGANDATWTHDVVPHGAVVGDTITSPLAFVGAGDDWRDLLEELADANAAQAPRLPWAGGVPFGWNSWGKIQTAISYDKAVAVSDFIKQSLQSGGFENGGVAYVNLDSYWDNLSDAQLSSFVAHCHANGQKAGVYWGPFVDWGKDGARQVEGAPGTTYAQIWLRDGKGNPIAIDGAYAVDPTHPSTKARIDQFIGRFKGYGFDYVKLDFLTHGALESTVRADPAVHTGIQAYSQGMQYIDDRVGGTMFISESIAPLFPYRYAHARRISCDAFGDASNELSSASYGWWLGGRLYTYDDPDQLVFEGFTAGQNMTRLLSSIVTGGIFIDGDDLTGAGGQALARTYLTSAAFDDLARLGKPFRPIDGNSGAATATALVLQDGPRLTLALFNTSGAAANASVDLARAGLDPSHAYAVTDLWTGAQSTATGTLTVSIDAASGKLLRLE
jgi:hypothetical protein